MPLPGDARRRNRNIGTPKQGHGQNNRMVIPASLGGDARFFWARLTDYRRLTRTINGHEFIFVVEATRSDSYHACSVDDVAFLLAQIPVADYGELDLIVFRQPKRKEEILRPAWGRLVVFYPFEQRSRPAIVLEASPRDRRHKWPRRLSVDDRREFLRLTRDGHPMLSGRRGYEFLDDRAAVRATHRAIALEHHRG